MGLGILDVLQMDLMDARRLINCYANYKNIKTTTYSVIVLRRVTGPLRGEHTPRVPTSYLRLTGVIYARPLWSIYDRERRAT